MKQVIVIGFGAKIWIRQFHSLSIVDFCGFSMLATLPRFFKKKLYPNYGKLFCGHMKYYDFWAMPILEDFSIFMNTRIPPLVMEHPVVSQCSKI